MGTVTVKQSPWRTVLPARSTTRQTVSKLTPSTNGAPRLSSKCSEPAPPSDVVRVGFPGSDRAVVPVQTITGPINEVLGPPRLAGTGLALFLVHVALGVPLTTLLLRNAFEQLQLHRDRDKFEQAGANLVVIGQGSPRQAARFLPHPGLLSPDSAPIIPAAGTP